VQKKSVLRKLFNELAPLYVDRDGGYTRVLRMGLRQGDNAQEVMLELVGTEITSQPKIKKPRKKHVEEEAPEAPAAEETVPEETVEEAAGPEEATKDASEEAPEPEEPDTDTKK
jgi:large subunit ribosomal protein L17